jgi:hypothetical protein
VTLQVKAQREIVFYSFYNCCKTQIQNAGLHTIFAQQWHILRHRGDLDPDPQVQAVHGLSAELTAHTKEIVLSALLVISMNHLVKTRASWLTFATLITCLIFSITNTPMTHTFLPTLAVLTDSITLSSPVT